MINIPTYDSHLIEESRSKGILFIGFDIDELQRTVKSLCPEAEFADWQQIKLDDGKATLDGRDIASFKSVLLGVIGDNGKLATSVQDYLTDSGVKCFLYGTTDGLNNKLLQTVRMARDGVPQIRTIITDTGEVEAKELADELGMPLVSKVIDGSKGRGVEKHDSVDELSGWLKGATGMHIFQEFVPNDGDYRVFFVGDEIVFTIKRTRDGDEFRNNTALGGKSEDAELPTEAVKIAKLANKCMGSGLGDVTGVDIVQNSKTKKWFVIEINAAPQIKDKRAKPVIKAIVNRLRS